MTKMKYYKQAEQMYVYEKQPFDAIGTKLNISRKTLFYWKKKYEWDRKRFKAERNQENFSSELFEFAKKLMQKISANIDNDRQTPQSEIYSLMNILKNLPQVKQQITEPKQKSNKKEYLPEDIVKIVERDILGM